MVSDDSTSTLPEHSGSDLPGRDEATTKDDASGIEAMDMALTEDTKATDNSGDEGNNLIHPELARFIEGIPWHSRLGLRVIELRPGFARLLLPFDAALTGNVARGALHGGVIASLADSCGSAALWTHFGPDDRTATIDLRVDYFRPAPLGDVIAEGEVRLLGNRIGNVHVRIAAAEAPDVTVAEGRTVCYVKRMPA